MKLIKKNDNNYELTNLTFGKLLAIYAGLKASEKHGILTAVGQDVKILLKRELKLAE